MMENPIISASIYYIYLCIGDCCGTCLVEIKCLLERNQTFKKHCNPARTKTSILHIVSKRNGCDKNQGELIFLLFSLLLFFVFTHHGYYAEKNKFNKEFFADIIFICNGSGNSLLPLICFFKNKSLSKINTFQQKVTNTMPITTLVRQLSTKNKQDQPTKYVQRKTKIKPTKPSVVQIKKNQWFLFVGYGLRRL